MKLGYTKKLFFLLTFTLLVASSSAMGSQAADTLDNGVSPDAVKLTVVTRHDSTIYQKYKQYFANSELGASVGITSPDEIEFKSYSTYSAFSGALSAATIGGDVAWGGGPTLFNQLIADNRLKTIDDTSLLNWINANVSDSIAGADMKQYDDENNLKWVAAAVSSFGFTVNNATLEARGLPFPTSWEDLASPEFFTGDAQINVAMGNAPDTTSNTRIYQIILQNYGWERGWEIIYSMAGNSAIYGGSVETRRAAVEGDVAVAMTIDFYGVIAMNTNPDTQYVIPEGASIVNGDPIAISAEAQELDAARAFTKYVLSEEGQALWLDDRINRLPVREDAFATAQNLISSDQYITQESVTTVQNLYENTINSEQGLIFDEDLALSLEEAMRYHFESTISNVHPTLRDAWGSIAENYNGGAFPEQRLDQLVDLYGDPEITLAEAQAINSDIITDPNYRQNIQGDWETAAIEKYQAAEDAVDDDFTITSDVTTTDSEGNTVTSQITTSDTANTVSDNVQDLPILFNWVLIAIVSPVIISKIGSKNKKH